MMGRSNRRRVRQQGGKGQAMRATKLNSALALSLTVGLFSGIFARASAADQPGKPAEPPLVRSAKSGPWSAPATWEGNKVPTAGAKIQVRAGHVVTYDLKSDQVIRSIHVAGTLTFARDR